MFLSKLLYHIIAFFKLRIYKIIYRKNTEFGKNITFRKSFELMISKEGRVEIGDNCFFNNYCSIFANQLVKIGNGTIFGENVKIYDHNHRFKDKKLSLKEQGFSNGEVKIGNHCWIGSNVIILKGAKIGDNCVIGAGCIIKSDIAASTIVTKNDDLIFNEIK